MVIAGFTDFCHLDILLSSPYIGLLHMCVYRWFILASTKLCVFACFGLGMCETTLSLNLGTEGVQLIMEDPLIFPFTYIVNILLIDTSCFLLPPTPWVFSMVGYYILRVITPFMMKVLFRNTLFRWIFASAVVLCTYLAFGFRLLVCSVLLFYLWYFLIYLMCIVCLSALLCSFANCFCYDSSIFGPFDYM